MSEKKISPSIMCADFIHLDNILNELQKSNTEYIHIDIMDGRFVPNFTLGTDFCRAIKSTVSIPLDIHLMVEHPEDKLSWFAIEEGDYVTVHYESTPHICRALQIIRAIGGKPMIALNPATPICVLENILDLLDGVLIMSVNPGFAGQKLLSGSLGKIRKTRDFLDANGYAHIDIEVDGNVSFENARRMSEAGANIFVAGTSSIFNPSFSLCEGISQLRKAIE